MFNILYHENKKKQKKNMKLEIFTALSKKYLK